MELISIGSYSIDTNENKLLIFFREYPVSGGLPENIRRPEDKQNYVLLLKELREQLDLASRNESKTYLLTVA